jgi:hypothetical protein
LNLSGAERRELRALLGELRLGEVLHDSATRTSRRGTRQRH